MSRRRRPKRDRDSYLSKDEQARARQLGNLVNAPAPERGNQRGLVHGAHSALLNDVTAEVAELMGAIAEIAPVRDPGGGLPVADVVAVELAARALKRWRLVCSYLDLHGELDERGQRRPASGLRTECETALWRAVDSLGLSPLGRGLLAADVGLAAPPAVDDELFRPTMTDPAVISASRELVRVAALAREREWAERGELEPPIEGIVDAGVDDEGG